MLLSKDSRRVRKTGVTRCVNPGSADSDPVPLIEANGVLFFVADDGTSGAELWKSDGVRAAARLLPAPPRPRSRRH